MPTEWTIERRVALSAAMKASYARRKAAAKEHLRSTRIKNDKTVSYANERSRLAMEELVKTSNEVKKRRKSRSPKEAAKVVHDPYDAVLDIDEIDIHSETGRSSVHDYSGVLYAPYGIENGVKNRPVLRKDTPLTTAIVMTDAVIESIYKLYDSLDQRNKKIIITTLVSGL